MSLKQCIQADSICIRIFSQHGPTRPGVEQHRNKQQARSLTSKRPGDPGRTSLVGPEYPERPVPRYDLVLASFARPRGRKPGEGNTSRHYALTSAPALSSVSQCLSSHLASQEQ